MADVDLIALAEKCEAATGDEPWHILSALAYMYPEPLSNYQPRGNPEFAPEWRDWSKRSCRVNNLIQARAPLEAAMALVPEGHWAAFDPHFMDEGGAVLYRGYTFRPDWAKWSTFRDWIGRSDDHPLCASPALAITAACLRARVASA